MTFGCSIECGLPSWMWMGGPGPTLLSELPRQIAGCIATYTRPTDMATLPIMGRGSITACVITMRGQPIMPPLLRLESGLLPPELLLVRLGQTMSSR